MNKLKKVLLSIFGGIERAFFIFSPLLLGLIWISLSLGSLGIIVFVIGLLATLFRAVKVGGWINE